MDVTATHQRLSDLGPLPDMIQRHRKRSTGVAVRRHGAAALDQIVAREASAQETPRSTVPADGPTLDTSPT